MPLLAGEKTSRLLTRRTACRLSDCRRFPASSARVGDERFSKSLQAVAHAFYSPGITQLDLASARGVAHAVKRANANRARYNAGTLGTPTP